MGHSEGGEETCGSGRTTKVAGQTAPKICAMNLTIWASVGRRKLGSVATSTSSLDTTPQPFGKRIFERTRKDSFENEPIRESLVAETIAQAHPDQHNHLNPELNRFTTKTPTSSMRDMLCIFMRREWANQDKLGNKCTSLLRN